MQDFNSSYHYRHNSYRHSYYSAPQWFINRCNKQTKVNTMLCNLTCRIIAYIALTIIVIVATVAIYYSAPVQALIRAAEITYKGIKASKFAFKRLKKHRHRRKH